MTVTIIFISELVFLDIDMPNMNVHNVAKKVLQENTRLFNSGIGLGKKTEFCEI